MNDAQLCQTMLGLEHPWKVTRVAVSHEKKTLDLWVEHAPGTPFCCPECAKALPVYDHAEERTWRHLDAFEFTTILHARPPRVECPEHKVRQAALPWAAPKGRFTFQMEEKIMATLRETLTLTGAGRLLRLSWDEVMGVMERAVERGLARRGEVLPEVVGVDEKAWLKGHTYFTVLADLDKGVILDIAKDRTKESLASLYETLTEKAKNAIKAVSMDMWNPYREATREHIPEADKKIVLDRYHATRMLVVDGVGQVRIEEARRLAKEGDESLKKTKYVFGKNESNLTERQAVKLSELRAAQYDTVKAWEMKEAFRGYWDQPGRDAGFKFFGDWWKWVASSGIKPMEKVAQAFMTRIGHLLNWFDHKASNGPLEGINSLIMGIKRRARGHRNFQNLRTALLFFLGGLDMALRPHPTAAH